MAEKEEKKLLEKINESLLVTKRIRKSIEEVDEFKSECSEIDKQVDSLSILLCLVRNLITNKTRTIYVRPVCPMMYKVTSHLEETLTLVSKCKRKGFLDLLVKITINSASFRKPIDLLESSIGDLKWVISISIDYSFSDSSTDLTLILPPIAKHEPVLAWVWKNIASTQMGTLRKRIEGAKGLNFLATDSDLSKKLIIEEGGVQALLKLLKDGVSSESQIVAATVLSNLASNQNGVLQIVADLGVPIIVHVLSNSSVNVQISIAKLVSRMVETDSATQEEFAREEVIELLVSYLTFDTFWIEPKVQKSQLGKILRSFRSVVQKEMGIKNQSSYCSSSSFCVHFDGINRSGNHRKERNNETPEVKLKLKVQCAEALMVLSKGSVSNSKRITETIGLLCLAKMIEKETGELQFKCLMTVMEIAAVAEFNSELRRAAFKTNSPTGMAMVEQLIRVIQVETPSLQILAIKAIGSLARIFTAKSTRVIGSVVLQLGHKNKDVAKEATITLVKFACFENFLCLEHSKMVIEFDGINPLMRLLKVDDKEQMSHGLVLLCYLALQGGHSDGLKRVRFTLEGAAGSLMAQHPPLSELIPKAISHLELYEARIPPQRPPYPL